MKSSITYGIQIFIAALVIGAVFDYLFRGGVNWSATAGFAAFLGAALGAVHAAGWVPRK